MSDKSKAADGWERDERGYPVIVADGVRYTLEPLDPRKDFAEVEDYLAKRRKRPIDAVVAELENPVLKAHPALQDKLIDKAYQDLRKSDEVDRPTRAEILHWLDTREGLIYTLGKQLAKACPDLAKLPLKDLQERAWDILAKAGLGEAQKMGALRDAANRKLAAVADAVRAAGLDPVELAKGA